MKQLFLTSSVCYVAADIAKRLDLTKGNRLVFITTAAEPETEDLSWLDADRQSLVDVGFDLVDYTITGKSLEQLTADLTSYDYIYLSGGNTLHLLQQSHKSGFISLIKDLIQKQGKTYIGTSAGSIIAGQKCPDYLLEDHEKEALASADGYGFVNFTLVPHWGSEDFRDEYLKDRLEIAYREDQVPLLLLTNNQYVRVIDDTFEIIDINTLPNNSSQSDVL